MIRKEMKILKELARAIESTGLTVAAFGFHKFFNELQYGKNFEYSAYAYEQLFRDERTIEDSISEVWHWFPHKITSFPYDNIHIQVERLVDAIPTLLRQMRNQFFQFGYPTFSHCNCYRELAWSAKREIGDIITSILLNNRRSTNGFIMPEIVTRVATVLPIQSESELADNDRLRLSLRDETIWQTMLKLKLSIECVESGKFIARKSGYPKNFKRLFKVLMNLGYVESCTRGYYLTALGIKEGRRVFSA